MKERRYTILLEANSLGGYTVTVPALPGIVTQGADVEESIARAKEAIALHIEGLIADGEPVPEELEPAQAIIVRVAA